MSKSQSIHTAASAHSLRRKAALVAMSVTFALAGSAAFAASKHKSAEPDASANAQTGLTSGVIARVNGVPITQDRLDAAVVASHAADTPALRAQLKNQLIARELFRQAAEKAHYEQRPAVQAEMEQLKAAVITQAWLQDQLKPAQIGDADVKAQYDKVVASLGATEFKPRVIATRDADAAQKVIDQLKKGTDFAQLARQYSQGPNAAQGGELGWISFKTPIEAGKTQNWPQPLAEALVKLPQGGVTDSPVQVDGTYWIVRADQERPTQIPSFDQSKETLRKQLEQVAQTKAAAALVLDLTKQARIEQ
ncbi:peptidylprolyl isomerase [Paraburkholderia bannensis]|uniref:peptidylprolyl isomerase n=1 Tax=Paraburkholderia bannensis TaxID=765414 RepID=UPI0005A67A77|nr:peptidyl-prolyl cis-trans isomerase [Paraburkholderia bannensis]